MLRITILHNIEFLYFDNQIRLISNLPFKLEKLHSNFKQVIEDKLSR